MFLSFRMDGLWAGCSRAVCHSICTFWTHYSTVEPPCSNFRVITANLSGVRNLRIFTVNMVNIRKIWLSRKIAVIIQKCEQCEPPHDKTNKMTVRPGKTQISLGIHPVWSESSLCAQWIAKDPSFLHADSEDWSDWADAQADLSLRWGHSHFVGFVMSRLMWVYQSVMLLKRFVCLFN